MDSLFRLRGPIAYNQKVIIIEIDDDNITQIGRWPWPRKWHAALTQALSDFGAKYIYFDMIFSEPSDPKDDILFATAIKKAENVYLPFAFQEPYRDIYTAFSPIIEFKQNMKGTGAINIYPDRDGTFRRIPLLFQEEKKAYPQISLKLASDYLDQKIVGLKSSSLLLSAKEKPELTKIPLLKDKTMLLNWSGKWKDTFRHYSYLDILNNYSLFLAGNQTAFDEKVFKDSICLVGITAIGLYELKPVPLEPVYPGIGILATAISNFLNKAFIKVIPFGIIILLVYLLPLIPIFSVSGDNPLRSILITTGSGIAFFILCFLLFKIHVFLDFSLPLLSLGSAYLSIATYNFIRVSVEKQRFFQLAINDGLTGLFNIRYFKMLLKTECLIANSNQNKQFSIIMSDIDHFKKFNDDYGHQIGDLVLKGVASVLKKAVRVTDLVARYGGEEMIILLKDTSLDNALPIAEKIRKQLAENPLKDKDKSYKVTISLGVSRFRSGDDEETIVKRADDALYRAKESGRNRVETIEK